MAASPSGSNVFLPNWQASGKLMVGYARNINKYACNRIIQTVPTKQMVGVYYQYDSREAARIDPNRYIWPIGQKAPSGYDALAGWQTQPFQTERSAPTFVLGDESVDQSDYDLVATSGQVAANKAMTLRTEGYLNALGSTNWGSHAIQVLASLTNGATPAVGGTRAGANVDWATGTRENPVIRRALMKGANLINKDTNSTVEPGQLRLVCTPDFAIAMSCTAEVNAYIANSPFALAQLRGDEPNQNGTWGLPSQLYGIEVEVEATNLNLNAKSPSPFTDSLKRALDTNGCYLISRVGELEGVAGSPSFSTILCFEYESFTVETRVDPNDRVTEGRVVQNIGFVVPAVESGVRFTKCFGTDPGA